MSSFAFFRSNQDVFMCVEGMEKGETDVFLEPCQISKMVCFAKIVHNFTIHLKYLTEF